MRLADQENRLLVPGDLEEGLRLRVQRDSLWFIEGSVHHRPLPLLQPLHLRLHIHTLTCITPSVTELWDLEGDPCSCADRNHG